MLITRNVTWQRVSSGPPVPAQVDDSPSTEEGGSEADDVSMSNRGGGGVMNELDDSLAHSNDLNMTWGFDLDACLQETARHAHAAGEAGDGTTETIDSSQGGAVDASSASMRRAETAETMDLSPGGVVDASSVPAGWVFAGSDPGAASASDTNQGNGEDLLAVLSGKPAHERSSWGRFPRKVWRLTRG